MISLTVSKMQKTIFAKINCQYESSMQATISTYIAVQLGDENAVNASNSLATICKISNVQTQTITRFHNINGGVGIW